MKNYGREQKEEAFQMNPGLLQSVSRIDRIIFNLHRYGFSSGEIAVIVSSSEDTVENKITGFSNRLNLIS